MTITQVGTSSLIGKIEHGQTTQISEDEVLGYKDLPVEAYEFSVLLRLGTTYELMDFLVRAQVAAAARMTEEHEETKMIQCALIGDLKPHEDRALQKIGQKKWAKNTPLLMELPDLNTTLIEAYRNLERTTRAAKEMARCSKTAQKQAEWTTEPWQASEQKLAVLEQQCQDRQPLSLLAPSNDAPLAPPQNPISRDVDTETQTYDTTHPVVAIVDATIMTDSVQPPVIETREKSTQADRAPCPQTSHVSTRTVPPPVVTTNDTST